MNQLTDTAIKKAKPGAHVIRMTDKLAKGLNLVITPVGTKTFFLNYTSPEDGTRKQKKLGIYPDTSLADARNEVIALRTDIRNGICPILLAKREEAQKQAVQKAAATKARAEDALNLHGASAEGTVADLFALYKADLQMDGKATKDMQQAYHLDIEPFLADRLANSITKFDIADVLSTIVARGSIRKADIVRGYLHRAFNLGLKAPTSLRWRKKAPDFKLEYNPVSVVEKVGKYTPGTRNLSTTEVHRLWSDVGVKNMRKDTALAIKLILSTGQRVQEVLGAKWSEFDLDKGVWSIPIERRKIHHKASHAEPHLVPLTSLHIGLLKELQGMPNLTPWLFPDADRKGPRSYNSLHLAVKRYCHPGPKAQREAFEHFAPRDLRRTFKTLSGKAGLSKEISDRLQGHAFQDVGSKNYDRYDYITEKAAAMATWTRWLDNVVKGKKAKVLQLKEAG